MVIKLRKTTRKLFSGEISKKIIKKKKHASSFSGEIITDMFLFRK